MIGQDRVPVDARRGGVNDQTAAEELAYFLRVKPDRRRVKAAYPPHLERRRTYRRRRRKPVGRACSGSQVQLRPGHAFVITASSLRHDVMAGRRRLGLACRRWRADGPLPGYRMAIGFPGDPVAPFNRSGANMYMNS